jgi:hypothetical protein
VIKNVLLIFLGFLLASITIWYSGIIFASFNSDVRYLLSAEVRQTLIWWGLSIMSIVLFTPIFIFFISRWALNRFIRNKANNIPAWSSLFFGGLSVFFFIMGIWLFSTNVYPYVPSAFGGNAPTMVQLVLSEYLSSMENFPIKQENGLSETLTLIDQTPTSFLIMLPDTGTVIEIPSSEVKGIIR